ncbi:MAG: hypothetical protein HOW97_21090 [Catenulispora sp.]|nr:hypothetical protein [Catenulispora sp.]
MRISRRTSRTTAVPRAGAPALRRTTAAGAALTLAVLTASACSSSSKSGNSSAGGGTGGTATSQSSADPNANGNDVQILNSLQLTASELDTAFATDTKWQPWGNYDPSKLLIKQAQACTANIIDTKAQTLAPVTTAFKADRLPSDPVAGAPSTAVAPPASPKTSSTKKGGTPSAPGSSSGPTSTSSDSMAKDLTPVPDQNPPHWVVSTAIVYATSEAARGAVNSMGKIDPNTVGCGGPADRTAIVGSGIGEIGPSWYGSQGVYVYADTKTNQAVTVVAQRRGRYVVLTYTRGYAAPQTGYYDLETTADTSKAADAATGVLGQLTDAVVNRG